VNASLDAAMVAMLMICAFDGLMARMAIDPLLDVKKIGRSFDVMMLRLAQSPEVKPAKATKR
jgi:hypothetical protein